MKILFALAAISRLLFLASATNNGLTDAVEWDEYSLTVNRSRLFVLGGEFHYQRLPVPELWPDIFQKFKANGFNALGLYFFWSYHSAEEGIYDFETSGKNLQKLFDAAKEAGLYVIARPGPYINAETNAGGYALWGSDGRIGQIRTNDERYRDAWAPYIKKLIPILAANQITEGGPVILVQVENELRQTVHEPDHTLVQYMIKLEEAFRDAGVVVPLTHNEKSMSRQSWSSDFQNVGGAVDVYALDHYPGALSCTNNETGFVVNRGYYQWFKKTSWTQPEYMAEFEGGWFSAWGSDTFYDECFTEHSPEFADVFYKNNIGQRITLLGIYMAYGGTNWGHSAAPVVYSSYDYSAPLRETRQIWSKLKQTKLLGLFTRVSGDLVRTEMVGNGTGYSTSSSDIFAWRLRNIDSNSTFTVIQHNNTQSRGSVEFSVSFDTSEGTIEVPGVSLDGRQSKILVTDYPFGTKKLLYATADILTYGILDTEVLVFYLQDGQAGKFVFSDQEQDLAFEVFGDSEFTVNARDERSVYSWKQAPGQTVVKFSNGVIVYLLERETAWNFWAPPKVSTPLVKPDEHLFVLGPYLVRSARIANKVLHISGDNDVATKLEAYVGQEIETVVWNGLRLAAEKTAYGAVTVDIPGADDRTISLPPLKDWNSEDGAPEIRPDFNDSSWTVCDHNETLNPFYQPATLPVLYSSDYGYYTGAKIYRGYFEGRSASAVKLTCSGGLAFGWNAWLNGKLIGGDGGASLLGTTNATLTLPEDALLDGDNVLTVFIDYHGHDQDSTGKGINNPRGILDALILPGGTREDTGFKTWKIQGNAGGSANIDPVRGPMNEGGLYPERLGWHLPEFETKGWTRSISPLDGIKAPGVRFYITSFHLNIDSDLDVPLGVELGAPEGTVARVMIWVNGYQYGKFVPHIGPQYRFPIPPGIINNRGKNTLALSLWAQTEDGAALDKVELFSYGKYHTDFKFNRDWSYLQPKWEDRSQYA
ncbi:unnamed protein product [Clonostachys chloroleuca]|uniref:beta-galactosidase n=1 Tax=Clonostachys chloroleuca TaxID=1926264 RepID=A0AA35M1J3_9HYPO|nr:unnamed protein product [Clonostachys chloroleuca]